MTQELEEHIKKGWNLDNETKGYYVISRKKPFSWGKFVTFTLFTGFGGFVYMAYYAMKTPEIKLLHK